MSEDGYRLVGGPGPSAADLAELDHACRVLDGAADRLDHAADALWRAVLRCPQGLDPVAGAAHRALVAAQDRHTRAATYLRALSRRLRRTVELYTDAESTAERGLRSVLVAGAGELGEHPLLAAFAAGAGVALAGVALVAAAPTLVERQAMSRAVGRPGPLETAGALPGQLTADGRAELAMLAAGAFVQALRPGRQGPQLRPVWSVAADLAAAVPEAGATVVVPRKHPPQLPTPRSTSDVLANVARSYDGSTPSGLPGTPEGTISVQRLTHPDGTRAWVVEIPGTEEWQPNTATPMDLTTNLRLLAGLPDDMTDAVLDAMAQAGIAQDEPVLLAGHSQGGMVAVSVAAAAGSAFTVRAVVTAGSPDTPHVAPAGVAVRHYRHDEDVVPQLDATPDRTSADVTVVRRDLGATPVPGRADRAPTPVEAHDINLYVETAASDALVGNPSLRPFDDVVGSVLGPPGTSARTWQFQATRDPAVVVVTVPRLTQG